MPIYDYVCQACGHRLEVIHGVHGQGPTKCPACGSRKMRKAIAAPAVLFKGSGWAKKDRRTSARRSSESRNATAATEAEGSGKTGTDEGAPKPAAGDKDAPSPAADGKDAASPSSPTKRDPGGPTSSSSPAGD